MRCYFRFSVIVLITLPIFNSCIKKENDEPSYSYMKFKEIGGWKEVKGDGRFSREIVQGTSIIKNVSFEVASNDGFNTTIGIQLSDPDGVKVGKRYVAPGGAVNYISNIYYRGQIGVLNSLYNPEAGAYDVTITEWKDKRIKGVFKGNLAHETLALPPQIVTVTEGSFNVEID